MKGHRIPTALALIAASACALTHDWSVADRTLGCTASVVFSAPNEIFYGLAVDTQWVYVVSFSADFALGVYSIYRIDKSNAGSAAKIYSGSSFVLACEATGTSLGTLCGVGGSVMRVQTDGTLASADGVNAQLGAGGVNVINDIVAIDGGVLFGLNANRTADAASGRVAFVSTDLLRVADHPEIKDPSRIVVRGNIAAVGRIATTNSEPLPPVSLYDVGALANGDATAPLFDDPNVTSSIADIAMLDAAALYALFDKGGAYALRRVAPDGAAAVPVSPLAFGIAATTGRVFALVYTDGTAIDAGPLSALAEIYDPSDWALLCSVPVPPPIRTPYGRHAAFDSSTGDVYFVDGQSLYVMHVAPAE